MIIWREQKFHRLSFSLSRFSLYGLPILHLQESGFHYLVFAVNADTSFKFILNFRLFQNTGAWQCKAIFPYFNANWKKYEFTTRYQIQIMSISNKHTINICSYIMQLYQALCISISSAWMFWWRSLKDLYLRRFSSADWKLS